ncbi:MAG: DNA-processing protein DprA, partial [Candidatus Eremiobacteraeota bacterium]|nr:DNA-processing protein DprA [Candidatus Eremiobacteraeota bacterium]
AEAMIRNGGAVLSPYAPECPARPGQFLQRNGVVAALADVVVIVEAAERSGALNTAGWAAALGIDVLAFPGDVDRPKAAGCNALIRDGATLVRHADDVLAALGCHAAAPPAAPAQPHRDPLERRVLEALAATPGGLDALLEATGGPIPQLLAALARLEIDGCIERRADSAVYAARQR